MSAQGNCSQAECGIRRSRVSRKAATGSAW